MSEEPVSGGVPVWRKEPEKRPPLRPLRLVVPMWAGDASASRALADGITQTYQTLWQQEQQWAAHTEDLRSSGDADPVRLAFLRGRIEGARSAAETLSDLVTMALDLWLLEDVQDQTDRAALLAQGDARCWRLDRPEIPLPADIPAAVAPLVELLMTQRDMFAASAFRMNRQGVDDYASGSPPYERYMGAAYAFAQAADDLDWLLARACGVAVEYAAWLGAHGSWTERLIGPVEKISD